MKNIIPPFFNVLAENYQSYCSHHKNQLKYVGIVGTIGYPLFYFIYKDTVIQPYDSVPIRAIATILCIFLALKNYWPEKIKNYYYGYSYLAVLYILPFFHVLITLKNNGNPVFIVDSFMAIFFVVLLTDWRNTIVMILLGSLFGSLLYVFTTDNPTLPIDYVSRIPMFILVVIGGSLFKFSEKLIQNEKSKALIALASAAHEMRNPLGQIKYALDYISHLLPTPNASNADHAVSVKTVNGIYTHIGQSLTSCNRGLQIIDITLREVGNQELDTTTFDYLSAATITKKAIEEYSFASPDERNRVSLHTTNDFTFKVDETAYIYIIFNLIRNALYYFQDHPNASIRIVIDHQKITITDTGPGIPEHILNKLFKNFTTVGKADGTGLGLAYCQRTMQAFRGKISCESVVGQYTTFTLTFPVISQEEIGAHTRAVFQEAIPLFKHKRILIVDDQLIYHASVLHLLEDMGCQIDRAENGQAVINMLRENQYDLIVMDIIMPGKDGYVTAEEIRSGIVPHQKNIAILAHTSTLSEVTKIKTQKAGMDGFIGKPCTQLELIKAICQVMECAGHRNSFEKTGDYLAGKTILIADDALVNRQYLEMYTGEWSMHALHAANGQAVLDVLEKTPHIDVVFMDMEMPLMNGVETTQRLRANPAHSDLIIIALTGNFSEQSMKEAIASGMNDFITKPFDKKVLRQKLIQLITARDQQQKTQVHSSTDSRALMPATEKNYAGISETHVDQSAKKTSATDAEINALTDSQSNRYIPECQSQEIFFKDMPLIDYAQLTSFQTNFDNRFQEFLQRFLSDLLSRDEDLQNSFDNKDIGSLLKALHSLVGFSGYIGGHALQQYIKLRLYSAVHAGHLPDEEAWIETVHALVKKSVDVLRRDYVKEQEKTG